MRPCSVIRRSPNQLSSASEVMKIKRGKGPVSNSIDTPCSLRKRHLVCGCSLAGELRSATHVGTLAGIPPPDRFVDLKSLCPSAF